MYLNVLFMLNCIGQIILLHPLRSVKHIHTCILRRNVENYKFQLLPPIVEMIRYRDGLVQELACVYNRSP